MAIVDIIIIALLLIGAIAGFAKGFVRSIFGFIGTLVAMVAAYFLIKPFVGFLQGIFDVQGMVNGWFVSLLGGFSFGDVSWSQTFDSAEAFTEALGQAKEGMGFAAPIFGSWFDSVMSSASGLDYSGGVSIASQLAPYVASPVLSVMAWLILFILLRIVLYIIERLLEKVLKFAALRTLDRFLGIFIGVAKVGVFLLVVLTIATLVFPDPGHVVMQYIMDSRVASWIISWNPIPGLLAQINPF